MGNFRTPVRAALAMSAVAVAAVVASPAQAATGPAARVTVVHGLRGLVADIWLDSAKVLPSFQPERATDPLPVPPGKHHIEIRNAGDAQTVTPLLAQDLTIPADADLTVVAHLDQAGKPALSVYRERASAVPVGMSRIVVRHAAAVAGIGVQLDQQPLVADVAPGSQAYRDVAPGTHAVAVTGAAGSDTPLLAPQDLPLDEGSGMVLYLIGSQSKGTLSWLAQPVREIRARATLPSQIATGDSGLRDSGNRTLPAAAGSLLLIALALGLLQVHRHTAR